MNSNSRKKNRLFKYKKVLVTGGAGFIGSAYIQSLSSFSNKSEIINIDKISYATSENTLKELSKLKNYSFINCDLVDKDILNEIYQDYQPDLAVNFAAESHVDTSIEDPDNFIKSNYLGVLNQLEIIRNSVLKDRCLFHQISTDEVFGDLELDEESFTEEHPYKPSSPYSSSKAGADLLVRAWSRTYGIKHLITNCSNNFGPRQHPEKMIPKVILNSLAGKDIPIYGDGTNIRDWLYVNDHVTALLLIQSSGIENETFNIGTGNEISNLELVELILKILSEEFNKKNTEHLKKFIKDRKGHDKRYSINSTKLKNKLSWKKGSNFEESLLETISWYVKHPEWWPD